MLRITIYKNFEPNVEEKNIPISDNVPPEIKETTCIRNISYILKSST